MPVWDGADNGTNFRIKEASITANSHSAGYDTSNAANTIATSCARIIKLVFNPK